MHSILVLVMSLLFLSTCGGVPRQAIFPAPLYDSDVYTDAITQHKHEVTLRLTALCPEGSYVGSGVAVSKDIVYTAKHVVECRNGSNALIIYGTFKDGRKVLLMPENKGKKDIASLRAITWASKKDADDSVKPTTTGALVLDVAFNDFATLDPRDPKIGEEVCFIGGGGDSSLYLEKCAKVFERYEPGFKVAILGVGGNSGGPIFDAEGNLLGIVSMRSTTDTATYIVSVKHLPLVQL